MTVSVIVDDADPEIRYGGSWERVTSTVSLGPRYDGISHTLGDTLHNATMPRDEGLTTSFEYRFTGSTVSVFALMTPDVIRRQKTNDFSYDWSCSINNNPTTSVPLIELGEPAVIEICSATRLNHTENVLQFNTTIGGILIDYLEYTPFLSTTELTKSYTAVNWADDAVVYNPAGAWTTANLTNGTTGQQTIRANASAEYSFTGTAVTWIGWLRTGERTNVSISINGTPHHILTLSPTSTSIRPNQIIFQSATLNSTSVHTIKALYMGNSEGGGSQEQLPLTLQSIIVANGTIPASAPRPVITPTISIPITSTSTPTPSPLASANAHNNHVLIIAVSVFGCLALICITLCIIAGRKRRSKNPKRIPSFMLAHPYPLEPTSIQRLLYQPFSIRRPPKGFRQLTNLVDERFMIPPSKLRRSAVNDVQMHLIPRDIISAFEGADDAETSLSIQSRIMRIVDIQEQDSGLRRVEDVNLEGEEIIRVVPPVYTAA